MTTFGLCSTRPKYGGGSLNSGLDMALMSTNAAGEQITPISTS